MVDAVIFDMDGTLLDSTKVVPTSYLKTFDAFLPGHGLVQDDIYARYPLGPPPRILADVLGRESSAEELAHYHEQLTGRAGEAAPYAGVRQMLEKLRALGLTLAVFTGADQISAEALIGAAGLNEFFELILGTEPPIRPKPATDGLEEVARRLHLDLAKCAYVGDGPLDIVCAHAAGAVPMAAEWGHLFDPPQGIETVIAASPLDVVRLLSP